LHGRFGLRKNNDDFAAALVHAMDKAADISGDRARRGNKTHDPRIGSHGNSRLSHMAPWPKYSILVSAQ
jgi:hypothetical protein